MQTFIPDASTLLKWVLPAANEAFLQQAAALRMTFVQGRVELLVPGLWVYEVGNTLARRHPESAGQRLDAIRKLGMREIHPDDAMIRHILELASRHKVTFYDAAYHALAIKQGGVFVTADEKYLQAIGDEPNARHIKDWV